MAKWKGTCEFCGKSFVIEGEAQGPGTPVMPCPLCAKPFYLIPALPPPVTTMFTLDFNDVGRNVQAITELTEIKWPLWFENFGKNAPAILSGEDMNSIAPRSGPALIVGAGPSIYRNEHLKILAKNKEKIPTIIATDRMLKPLVEHGITPTFVTTVDGSPLVSSFYNLPEKVKTDVLLDAITTHPETLKEVQKNITGKIYWFVHFMDNPLEERCAYCRRLSITSAFHFLSGKKMITQAGGNAGAFAWHLASHLGCDPIILIGMDYSYPADIPIEKTMYYDSFLSIAQGDKEKASKAYQRRANPEFANEYTTDLVWETYRLALIEYIKASKVRTVNATGGGALFEAPIISMGMEDALKKFCSP